jgi:hypothetical protein
LKGQFATIEALSSLLIAISVVCLGSQMINNSQQSLVLERGDASAKAAAYDFLVQLLHNQSTQRCAAIASIATNGACMNSYSDYYKMIYGVGIVIIKDQQEEDNHPDVYCEGVSNSTVCFGVS